MNSSGAHVMSRTQTMPAQVVYTTKADATRRHEQGVVSTSKKTTLTGGGRAWSEDEEAYLVQTRLQKMPYKHIAAHLKKTELACRLHYHQLSHGSNRRKRALSISSGSDHSPELPASMSDPMLHERQQSVSLPPPRRTSSYGLASSGSDVQLPSIMGSSSSSRSMSPRLPAILPKPVSTPTHSQPGGFAFRYPSIMHDEQQQPGHLPPVNFHHHHQQQQQQQHHHHQGPRYQLTTPPPRLERSPLPLPSMSAHAPPHVDLARLQAIYEVHRDAFWGAVAKDYGANVSPGVLETAWRTGVCGGRPITPAATPEAEMRRYGLAAQDKTSIASILAADEDGRGRR